MPLFWTVKPGKKTRPPGNNRSRKSLWNRGRDCLNQKAVLWIEVSFWKYINSFRPLEYRFKSDFSINNNLLQGFVKYNPWSISDMPPVSVIKFYWDTAMLIHLCVVYDCFCTSMAELSSCDGDQWCAKSKIVFTLWTFIGKVHWPQI